MSDESVVRLAAVPDADTVVFAAEPVAGGAPGGAGLFAMREPSAPGPAVLVVVPVVPVPGPEFVLAAPEVVLAGPEAVLAVPAPAVVLLAPPALAAVLFVSEVIIHSTDLNGTATSFSPIPKNPPTPMTTASALPLRSTRTSLTSPIRSLFAPYTLRPTSFEARQWLADCWAMNLPDAADDGL